MSVLNFQKYKNGSLEFSRRALVHYRQAPLGSGDALPPRGSQGQPNTKICLVLDEDPFLQDSAPKLQL